jgi:hypothetical protein
VSCKGISTIASTSSVNILGSGRCLGRVTKGTIVKLDVKVWTVFSFPLIFSGLKLSPISSFVSLKAVSSKFESFVGEYCPPGNEISPLWDLRLELLFVKSMCGIWCLQWIIRRTAAVLDRPSMPAHLFSESKIAGGELSRIAFIRTSISFNLKIIFPEMNEIG